MTIKEVKQIIIYVLIGLKSNILVNTGIIYRTSSLIFHSYQLKINFALKWIDEYE